MLERYYGSAVDVAVALVRDTTDSRPRRLEVVCAPDVHLEQEVEELLFRAYWPLPPGSPHVRERPRPGAVPAHDLRRHRRSVRRARSRRRPAREDAPVECARVDYLRDRMRPCQRPTSSARPSGARSSATWPAWAAGLTVMAAVGVLLSLGLATLPDISRPGAAVRGHAWSPAAPAPLLSVLFGMTSGNLRLHTLFANAESGIGRSSPPARCGRCWARCRARSSTSCCRADSCRLKVPDGAAGTHFYIALAIVAGVQRAVGARCTGRYRGADQDQLQCAALRRPLFFYK